MSINFMTQEELKEKVLKAITAKLKYQYRGKDVVVHRISGITEIYFKDKIKAEKNSFSFVAKLGIDNNGLDEIKSYTAFNASFNIDEDGKVKIEEPLVLI